MVFHLRQKSNLWLNIQLYRYQHRTLSQHRTLRLSTSHFTVANIRVLNQHPTLQLPTLNFTVADIELCSCQHRTFGSTSNCTVANIGLLAQHPTVQLSTSDYRLNIPLYSYRHQTLSRQHKEMFDFAKSHVRLCKVDCLRAYQIRQKLWDCQNDVTGKSLAFPWTFLYVLRKRRFH